MRRQPFLASLRGRVGKRLSWPAWLLFWLIGVVGIVPGCVYETVRHAAVQRQAVETLERSGAIRIFYDPDYSGSVLSVYFGPSTMAEQALRALERLPDLREIGFDGTAVSPAQMRRLAQLKPLRQLKLLEESGTREVLACLSEFTRLEGLTVASHSSNFDDGAAANVAGLTRLRCLGLAKAKLTDRGASHLARLRNLAILDLGGTQLGDAGLRELCAIRGLKVLQVRYTRVSDKGMHFLKEFAELEVLDLTGNRITDSSLDNLKALRHLRVLSVVGCDITDAGLIHLESMHGLRTIEVSESGVTDHALARLRNALPNCDVSRVTVGEISPPAGENDRNR